MKKVTRVLALLLVFAFSLTACSGGEEPEPADQQETQEEEEEAEDVADDTAEDEGEEEAEEMPDYSGRTLNVIATSEKYQELFDQFTEETGADVEFLSMSSGEVLSRVKAEGKPMADLWFGGGLDAFLAAKDEGILAQYDAKGAEDVSDDFKDPEGYWYAKGITVVGFMANDEVLESKGLEIPRTWEELADPKYKDEVIMSTPAVSGTMFAAVKGVLDEFGEEKGWEYWEKLDQNIPFYGKRGKDPQEKTVADEFAVGIIPADKSAFDAAEEHGMTVVYPEDGIPWVPEGVAVFDGAEGEDIAKTFIDFMLRDDVQEKIAELDGKDGAQMIKPGIEGYDLGLDESLLIDENLPEFGSKREEILDRWQEITGEQE